MEQNNYQSGYTDFNAEIAEEINQAHHLRYIKTPSGRKLYMMGSVEQDADEIEEIKAIRAACNNAAPSSIICELEDRATEIRRLKSRVSELEAAQIAPITNWVEQQKHDASLCRALSKEKPYCDQPWARMALFIAGNAIERGRLLTTAEKNENLAVAFDEEGDHEIAAKIRAAAR